MYYIKSRAFIGFPSCSLLLGRPFTGTKGDTRVGLIRDIKGGLIIKPREAESSEINRYHTERPLRSCPSECSIMKRFTSLLGKRSSLSPSEPTACLSH